MKIEKQNTPIFFNEQEEPIACLIFHKSRRIIYTIKTANEDEIINLYEQKDKPIKNN